MGMSKFTDDFWTDYGLAIMVIGTLVGGMGISLVFSFLLVRLPINNEVNRVKDWCMQNHGTWIEKQNVCNIYLESK